MREIDAKPTDYRRENPETGAMEYPVNRPLCRWMAVIGAIFLMWFAFSVHWSGGSAALFAFPAIMGAAIGSLLTLSFRR